jgi:hypothetical protein
METENRKAKVLEGAQKESSDAPEESMEDWFNRGVGDIEEGEVVRGRSSSPATEVLVDIGYKSEGTIMEGFRHVGALPKVGDEIESTSSQGGQRGLIVLSKDKADRSRSGTPSPSPTTAAPPSGARWSRWSRAGSPSTWAFAPSCQAPRSTCGRSRTSPPCSAR